MSAVASQLILTADERMWPPDGPVLFLGEWCKLYSRKSKWQSMDYQTVQHPWRDFDRFQADYANLRSLYARLLPRLVQQLNTLHGTKHGERYWRILIGPWLATFIHIAFERWTVLTAALEGWCIAAVVCPRNDPALLVTLHTTELHACAAEDDWNGLLFAAILKKKGIPYDMEPTPQLARCSQTEVPRTGGSWKSRILGGLAQAYAGLCTRRQDAFMIATYVPLERLVRMQVGLKQFPMRPSSAPVAPVKLDPGRRSWRLNSVAEDAFEELLCDLLPQAMPRVFIEGYQNLLVQVASRPWPEQPRLIFSSNALWTDEVTMAYTAAKVEAGSALLYGQHGGLYGVGAFSWAEEHERAIADRYITWGWSESPVEKFAPVGYFKRQLGGRRKYKRDGYLTVVCYEFPRYTHRLDSEAMVMQTGYLDRSIKFGLSLQGDPLVKLLVRLTPRESGWYQASRWGDKIPGVAIDRGKKTMQRLMSESRLMVYTYNSTGFLEAFVSGTPCIMFWDPAVSRLRADAEDLFNALRGAGILHDSPQSAAAHVQKVWDDVPGWWYSQPVQAALRSFCSCYCSSPDIAHSELFRLLKDYN